MENKVRVIVCGSRGFEDKKLFDATLDVVLKPYERVEIISGHAKGADSFGEEYAKAHQMTLTVFQPDWRKNGRSAGPVRNKAMLEYALQRTPLIIAFWDGMSRGTKNMIEQGKKAGAMVQIIRY